MGAGSNLTLTTQVNFNQTNFAGNKIVYTAIQDSLGLRPLEELVKTIFM